MGRGQTTASPGPTNTGQGQITASQDVVVSTKPTWGATEWEVRSDLQAIRSTAGLAPHIDQAFFKALYGSHHDETATAFTELEPYDLQNHYVKIEVLSSDTPRIPISTWIGQFVEDGRTPAGVEPTSGTGSTPNPPSGEQVFTAFGLEHILKKATIDRSYAENSGTAFPIHRPLSFNRKRARGGPLEGNAGSANVTDAFGDLISVFTRDGLVWNHFDIIEYLLHYFVNERSGPKFKLVEQVFQMLAGPNHETVENFFGMTVFEALNKLIDRRRGLTWFVRVAAGTDDVQTPVQIIVQSTLENKITIGNDVLVEANPNQVTYDFDSSIRVQRIAVKKSSVNQYRYIQVTGAPVRAMTTLNFTDGSLEKGWTDDEETLYKNAASGTEGYSSLTEQEKAQRNDRYRRESPLVSHVYTRFVVPVNFNWRAGDGLGGNDNKYCIMPTIKADTGEVEFGKIFPDPSADFLNGQKGFMRELLILKRTDYTTGAATQETPDTEVAEYAEPFVFVKHRISTDDPFRYHVAHKMGAQSGNNLPSAGLRMLNGEPGFELILSGSTPNHAWALDTWDADANEPSEFTPTRGNAVDYRNLSATLAIETDQALRVVVDIGAVGDNGPRLTINVPDLHHWSATARTRWRPTDDSFDMEVISGASSQAIRDDSPQLRRIAAFVKAWYGRERRSIDVTFAPPMIGLELGALLLALASSQSQNQTNTVVSLVEHDYLEQTVRNTTDFVDLDLRAIFGGGSGAGADSGTASLPPTRRVVKDQVERITRIEEQLSNLPVHAPVGSSGITDAFIGKIVSWHKDFIHVARMEHGDPSDWANQTFTDERRADSRQIVKCVWAGVGAVKSVEMPVLCFKPANSSRYVAILWYNTVGDWDDAGGTNGEFQAAEPPAADTVDPGDSVDGPIASSDDAHAAECAKA